MSHLEPVATVILWGNLLLFLGIVGRYLGRLCHQPGVLGELLMGILVGNICYFAGTQFALILRECSSVFDIVQHMLAGMSLTTAVETVVPNPEYATRLLGALSSSQGSEWLKVAYVVDIFSRYGVIFLLFIVGLETSVAELKHTGREAFQVAVIGVIAPILLGLAALYLILPQVPFKSALFVAAALSATSVGITARVLRDMKKVQTREARTILGAAMIDDILGLMILAIVSDIALQGHIEWFAVGKIILLAVLFFSTALLWGPWLLRCMIKWLNFVEPWEAKLLTVFLFMMALAWLATWVQLAAIIGAFIAGMIVHEGFFEDHDRHHQNHLSIKNLIAPFEAVFAPLFFTLIGIQVKLETFLDWHVLVIAIALIFVAILGKLVSGFGGKKSDDRLLIGLGMLPRGEVGLIFASIGKSMGVVSDQIFSAIVCMVVVTTILAPIGLKARYKYESKHAY